MVSNPRHLLDAFAALAEGQERSNFVFQHPSLLSKVVQDALAAGLAQLPADQRSQLLIALDNLRKLRKDLEEGREQYVMGYGPIELLWSRVQSGELSEKYAEEQARAPDVVTSLSPIYVSMLSKLAMTTAEQGNWRLALQLQRLVLGATNAVSTEQEELHAQWQARRVFIAIVKSALIEVPDGRLYRRALEIGEQAAAQAEAANDRDALGLILHRLGVLHLDPYVVGRDPHSYKTQKQQARQRLYAEVGEAMAWISQDTLHMPPVEEALKRAEHYLYRAADLQQGQAKGFTLKALVQALAWESYLGQSVDEQEIARLSQEALKCLDPLRHPVERLELLGRLQQSGQPIDSAEARRFLEVPLQTYLRYISPKQVIDLALQMATTFRQDDPLIGLGLLRDARELVEEHGRDEQRAQRWELMSELLDDIYSSDVRAEVAQGIQPETIQRLRERAQQGGWDRIHLCVVLLSLARHSTNQNAELIGLGLLGEAARVAPDFLQSCADMVTYIRYQLLIGAAVNAVNTADWESAVEAYAAAVSPLLDLSLHSKVPDCLARMYNVLTIKDSSRATAVKVVAHLPRIALRLETETGEPGTWWVQTLCQQALTVMMKSGQAINLEALIVLLQLAKGLRFATALYGGRRYEYQRDEQARRLLQQIDALVAEIRVVGGQMEATGGRLDQDLLLSAYERARGRRSGATLSERLTNLQQSFDEHVNRQLLANVTSQGQTLLMTQAAQRLLDEQTVLLNFYRGTVAEGDAMIAMLLTREEIRVGSVAMGLSVSPKSFPIGERAAMPIWDMSIGKLRDDLVAEPGPWVVDRNAGQRLATDLRYYLGNFVEALADLRAAGKDHLLVVPHAAMHYHPLHLIGEPGKPLADQWTVSYMPNLYLLAHRGNASAASPTRNTMAAIGLSFQHENPFGLAAMPNSIHETESVGAIFGVEPVLEQQASKAAVIEALQSSRYVHISTHGKHNVDAPAFQCLYLSPDGESDGQLYAYELLALDLRGVELLTLSACETALGRFDIADNIRGLPASFLLAGVSTIIAALWPAAAAPAQHFFTVLYGEIKAGARHRDAFRSAQLATRAQFPKYRDWGAFCMIGAG